MLVSILGMGCSKCCELEFLLKEISKEEDIDITIIKEESIESFIAYKIESTPALLIANEVMSFEHGIYKEKVKQFILSHKNDFDEKTA